MTRSAYLATLSVSILLFSSALAKPEVPTQDCYQLEEEKVCPECVETKPADDGISLICTKWENTFTPITEEEKAKAKAFAGAALFSPRGGVLNPYARPDGPVFGKLCRTRKGKEECPKCVDIRTPFGEEPTCEKFEWYTPDNEKAKKWDAKVKAEDDRIAKLTCTKKDKQCGSSLEGGDGDYLYNPLLGGDGSPCCEGLACKPDPKKSVGKKKEAFYCTSCTKNMQQCAGAANENFVDYAPCCSKSYECTIAPELGYGKWCLPSKVKKA